LLQLGDHFGDVEVAPYHYKVLVDWRFGDQVNMEELTELCFLGGKRFVGWVQGFISFKGLNCKSVIMTKPLDEQLLHALCWVENCAWLSGELKNDV